MDQTIRLWDAASGAIVAGPLVGHTDSVNGVAFSPDGNRVASCSNDKTIRMWDVYAGSTVGNPFEGHQGGITALAFSPDGTQIVSGGDYNDRNIIVWDVGTGLTHASAIHRHTDWVRSVLFSPDGSRIISCSYDQTIRIWRAQTEEHDYVQDHGQTKKIQAFAGPLAFSPDRGHFVSNSPNGTLVVSELLTGAIILNAPEENPDPKSIDCLALSSQGLYLATSMNNFTIQVWNVRTGAMISQPLKGHNDSVRCLSFSPDGRHLCSGSDDSTLIIWDIEASSMSGQTYYGHTGPVRSVAYSPDGIIASGAADYTIRVWNSATGALVYSLDGHKDSVESVALSHDGRYMVSGSRDGSIRKWDLDGKRNMTTARHFVSSCISVPNESIVLKQSRESINCIGLSPDSTQVVAGYQSIIYIFDVQTASIISELYVVGYERICWVGFSPDYNGIISLSKPQKIRSYDSSIEGLSEDYNTIRIWRAGSQVDSSSDTYWSPKPDGRILSPEGFVIWVPPDLLQHLSLSSKSYFNPFVLSADGIIDIGYEGLCIGDRWAECYIHEV
ncbi:unnamed protein product [Rhizoctonia solani]|uniref:Uncharacterized protein n=1 Tax=Rhizoctonia solani TaxID=456999 RepID=A0A8H3C560_9AGAM|nr:unnamed protein product [Rhizoctonia solani]